tara:strand:+ start:276 stop:656 length:381 start_codon:yes stop_codon:yes gene_type:complete
MASSHLVSKTISLHEKKDPIRNLWRNVLIQALEDLLKNKELQAKRNEKKFSKEEIWFYSEDFKLVCEYAQFEYDIVRKRTFESIEKIRKKYAKNKNNMSEMPRQWLYKTTEINRQSNTNNRTMSVV